MMIRNLLLTCAMLLCGKIYSQNNIALQLQNAILSANTELIASPLKVERNNAFRSQIINNDIREGNFFSLNETAINKILRSNIDILNISLENQDEPLVLKLYEADFLADDFSVYLSSDRKSPITLNSQKFFWGIVNNDQESIAAITINKNEVSGFIYYKNETYNLGKLTDTNTKQHILYKESDLLISSPFGCEVDDTKHVFEQRMESASRAENPDNCVNMYIEIDNDIVIGKGGTLQAIEYVTNAFAQVAILYANESINFKISEIIAWDTVDPYTGPSTSNYLSQFRAELNGVYNGDLAHLVGYQGSGGIAYVNVLCNKLYGVGYSDINASFSNVPTYSWTIEVLTHEIGHNLGSRHTHNCVWNGNNTAIDRCGPAAGYDAATCNESAPVPNKGTIMSYCHLVSGVGIDFNLGFGPQPGDLIRNRVYNASCLTACTEPQAIDAALDVIVQPSGTLCQSTIDPIVEVRNAGTETLTSFSIVYDVDGTNSTTFNWSGSLASNASTNVTLPSITFTTGNHAFNAFITLPNGGTDNNENNNSSTSTFSRQELQTFYSDSDNDGFGDPANTIQDCTQPSGYVSNNLDCAPQDGQIYPGGSCNDGNICTENDAYDEDCNCSGTFTDSDGDGICDGEDVCPGGDDTVDSDGDGTPDFCDCNPASASFPSNSLSHSGSGNSSTSLNFSTGDKNVTFTISGLEAVLNGNPSRRYNDEVVVTYTNGNGNNITYATYQGSNQASASVDIQDYVTSLSVSLRNANGSTSRTLSVQLSSIDYCRETDTCNDEDNDGICDIDDVCPGGDDTVDTDGDGIPDFCDNDNCDPGTFSFTPSPLTHSGTGSSTSTVFFPSNAVNISFTISGLNAITGGKKSDRFIEEVTVTYTDINGQNITYGTFNGSQQSSVNVEIGETISNISVTLSEGLDGNPPSTLSVNLSEVNACLITESTFGENQVISDQVKVYPNPAQQTIWVKLENTDHRYNIDVINILGQSIFSLSGQGNSTQRIDLDDKNIQNNIVFIRIQEKGAKPIVKKVIVNN